MKPLISLADYDLLVQQVTRPFEKKLLRKMKKKATLAREEQMPDNAVRLNSVVYLWHSFLKRVVRFRLVPPLMAELSKRNLSAFSPLGQAVFGYSENDRLRVEIGGLRKELKIIRVVNK